MNDAAAPGVDPHEPPVLSTTRIVVDCETFDVHLREPGIYDYAWLSGPNEGYGFTVARNDRTALDDAEIETHARSFLAEVDPSTGYIE